MSEASQVEKREYGGRTFDVVLCKAADPDASGGKFPPLEPGTSIVDGIVIERDVAVVLRDGVTIYTDVYRPEGATNVPAIVAWSPYGKRASYVGMGMIKGVPEGTYSPATKWEGPDPEYWCHRGYAVVNPDARGAGRSEGILQYFTRQEARDTADLIDWAGEQSWCNGKVGMSGSSWLGGAQWAAAAEQPKHLAAIAPWEGSTDMYRQRYMPGGIPGVGFTHMLAKIMAGPGLSEDLHANMALHPMLDDYWAEKISVLERIEVPIYACAGWQHFHLPGSIEGFNRASSKQKWLRVHREFEWPDYYAPENLADLELFFERFLKGRRNGWEMTPPVRLDVMDRGDRDRQTRRPETSFPLPDEQHRKLFLDATNAQLCDEAPAESAKVSYDAVSGRTHFDYTFARDTELTGYFKLRLWVEAQGADDMDLFIALQKADAEGREVPTLVMGCPHPGAEAMLRVSHRELDEAASTEVRPVQLHANKHLPKAGEVVPVDLAIWPTSRFWHAGERLRIVVSGHYVRAPGWFEPLRWDVRNAGTHVIHTGGTYDSHLLIPEIPALRAVIPGRSITSIEALPGALA